ncbi:hypothetical protein SARC_04640 [Sphaeroforma arctica JP610]|uniref:Thioredoxin domain-containing protein n=1 Tax=Sphaeroforma arctica JP610 TaxID=667725 RepID=A0A0L0G1V1_9EUKA|nr:hypothetical protein SARC_04640 [Sphaeroforma arctica JP610]KNC83102.1 hypothetical protein SARC_04640 [Sphaeroforma arctica JP610]|eukprot:XP_014157004.1 hypothetical protein SARC_04640 [Sphaeroforma arctica JP610]
MGLIKEMGTLDELWTESAKGTASGGKVFLTFTSDWCPDCLNLVPPATKAFEGLSGPNDIMYLFNVGDKEVWRNPENPLRTDDRTKLTAIPTIIDMNSGVRLVEGECTVDAVEALLA